MIGSEAVVNRSDGRCWIGQCSGFRGVSQSSPSSLRGCGWTDSRTGSAMWIAGGRWQTKTPSPGGGWCVVRGARAVKLLCAAGHHTLFSRRVLVMHCRRAFGLAIAFHRLWVTERVNPHSAIRNPQSLHRSGTVPDSHRSSPVCSPRHDSATPATTLFDCTTAQYSTLPNRCQGRQHFLYFLPLPHGHGALGPTLRGAI